MTKYLYDSQSRLSSVLYPLTNEKVESDRNEAERAGLFFTSGMGNGERYMFSGAELAALRNVLNMAAANRGNIVNSSQMMWSESYTYDRNGNRATKTTSWGTIRYEYDAENRMVRRGEVVITNDRDGNMLSERGLRHEARYEYNGQNRMVLSEVTNRSDRTRTVTMYAYDALGRRTLTESITGQAMRVVYDGFSFDVIREGEVFRDAGLTTGFNNVATRSANSAQSSQLTGERYRRFGENGETRTLSEEDGYTIQGGRFGTRGVALYANGEAVAVSYSSRVSYLGKDIMGSVRSVTGNNGVLEDRFEYDVFGTPFMGDLSGGMNLGYMSKPFNAATGFYNYGFRDYKPQAARFTTVDPIRDGNNWFVYVNNDPVNYIDLWGLCAAPVRFDPTANVPNPDITNWINNLNGTFTAGPGATLYGLYGPNWQTLSGFDPNRDPRTLQAGETVGIPNPTPPSFIPNPPPFIGTVPLNFGHQIQNINNSWTTTVANTASDLVTGVENFFSNTATSATNWYNNLNDSTQNRLSGTGITLASIVAIAYTGARVKKGGEITIQNARNIITAIQFTGLGIAQIATGKPIFGDRRLLGLFIPIEAQVVSSIEEKR